MLSPEQIALNRASLANVIRNRLGLPDSRQDWSYSQQWEFSKAFAAYVLDHPASFGEQDLRSAQIIAAKRPDELEDTSTVAEVKAFASAFGENVIAAADDVGGIGRGVLTAAQMAAWVIPGGLLILAGIYLFGKYKKAAKGVAVLAFLGALIGASFMIGHTAGIVMLVACVASVVVPHS